MQAGLSASPLLEEPDQAYSVIPLYDPVLSHGLSASAQQESAGP